MIMRMNKGFSRIPFVVAGFLLAILIVVTYFTGFDGVLNTVVGGFNETASTSNPAMP